MSTLESITCEDIRDSGRILARLRDCGVCILPNYFSEVFCESFLNLCQERSAVEEDVDFPDGSYKRFNCYKGTAAEANNRIYHVDCFSTEGHAFKTDSFLGKIVSDYYRSPHSVHVCVYERHGFSTIPVRGFHIDTFETSTLKAFLYLSDVDIEDGPFSYIVGTHSNTELRYKKEHEWAPVVSNGDLSGTALQTNFSETQLGELLNNFIAITGSAGTVILFDTWGVHKGCPVSASGDRHVAVNYYRKGANLPRSDFGFDVQKDTKRYHAFTTAL